MEPNYSGYNGQGLMSSAPEGVAAPPAQEEQVTGAYPEQAWPPATPEASANFPAAGMPLPTTGSNGMPAYQAPVQPPVAAAPAQMAPVASPALADDADLIEKEWVEAAKQIVMRTQGDPYSKSQAMNVLRADYMKKRYNKDIKVPEGQ